MLREALSGPTLVCTLLMAAACASPGPAPDPLQDALDRLADPDTEVIDCSFVDAGPFSVRVPRYSSVRNVVDAHMKAEGYDKVENLYTEFRSETTSSGQTLRYPERVEGHAYRYADPRCRLATVRRGGVG